MASVILYQWGSKSKNPKTGSYYDPWSNHIWLCVEQIRKWNPKIPIYMITDSLDVSNKENFEIFNVTAVLCKELPLRYDIDSSEYLTDDSNPIGRWGTLRTFYIESLMRKNNIENVFTFDNDVLVYTNLEMAGNILGSSIKRSSMTPDSYRRMVFGMCFIKNHQSISDINDDIWSKINSDEGKHMVDMDLWQKIRELRGDDYVSTLPIWPDGDFSGYSKLLGGVFDPSSIGQHLGGCDNGNPPGCIFPHHYIHRRLYEGKWKFVKNQDQRGLSFFSILNTETGALTKIMSIHMHNKKLRDFM